MRITRLILMWGLLGLAGCQSGVQILSNQGVPTATIPTTTANSTPVYQPNSAELVQVMCQSEYGCSFSKLDDLSLVERESQVPNPVALRTQVLKPNPSASNLGRYYIQFNAGSHEVRTRFYPVTAERPEVFSLIHNFKPNTTYVLKMYRQHDTTGGNSLLNVAMPDPLCIDLVTQERTAQPKAMPEKVSRRFCRPFNPKTGLGEFVEQRVIAK